MHHALHICEMPFLHTTTTTLMTHLRTWKKLLLHVWSWSHHCMCANSDGLFLRARWEGFFFGNYHKISHAFNQVLFQAILAANEEQEENTAAHNQAFILSFNSMSKKQSNSMWLMSFQILLLQFHLRTLFVCLCFKSRHGCKMLWILHCYIQSKQTHGLKFRAPQSCSIPEDPCIHLALASILSIWNR